MTAELLLFTHLPLLKALHVVKLAFWLVPYVLGLCSLLLRLFTIVCFLALSHFGLFLLLLLVVFVAKQSLSLYFSQVECLIEVSLLEFGFVNHIP